MFYVASPLWRASEATPAAAALAWAVTFALAAASFRYLEQPALRLKARLASARRCPQPGGVDAL